MRDRFVTLVLEQRANFFVRWSNRRSGCTACRRRSQPAAGFRLIDIARDDAAMRAGAIDARNIDAGVLRETAGEW